MTNYLVTLRGQLGFPTLAEIFAHSFAVQSAASQETLAGAVRTYWQNAWGSGATGLGQHWSTQVSYTEVTTATILDLSNLTKPTVSAATHAPFEPPLVGGSASGMMPTQCSLAVSISGGLKPNGAPAKGRFYLPAPAVQNLLTDGTLNTTPQQSIGTNLESFFTAMNLNGHVMSLWSRKFAVMHIVTQMRVGNKIDTIRSRRNQLPEVYDIHAITGPA